MPPGQAFVSRTTNLLIFTRISMQAVPLIIHAVSVPLRRVACGSQLLRILDHILKGCQPRMSRQMVLFEACWYVPVARASLLMDHGLTAPSPGLVIAGSLQRTPPLSWARSPSKSFGNCGTYHFHCQVKTRHPVLCPRRTEASWRFHIRFCLLQLHLWRSCSAPIDGFSTCGGFGLVD